MVGICSLQQSTQQAEDALSQGMDVLKQSLLEILSSTSSVASTGSGNVADYMGQMAFAMSKLASLEEFLHQVKYIYRYSFLVLFLFIRENLLIRFIE